MSIHISVSQEERDNHERRMMRLSELACTMDVLRGFERGSDGRIGLYDFDKNWAAKEHARKLLEELFPTQPPTTSERP